MPWAKLDDQYPDHPKIVEVGPLGMALHTAALCYCARYLTDGFVPIAMIPRLINLSGIYTVNNGVTNTVTHKEITDELTRVGLFEEVPGGFKVHDYLDYNPPAEQVKAERAANAARQAEWKAKKGKKTGGNTVNNGVTNTSITGAPSPSPNPLIKTQGADAPVCDQEKKPRKPIELHDPMWDMVHGKTPSAPADPPPPDTTWVWPDVIELAQAFFDTTKLPPPPDDSTRSYWNKELRFMRLNDSLTQDDIRRAVRKMRSTGATIKSPESVRTVALDIRASNQSGEFAEVY